MKMILKNTILVLILLILSMNMIICQENSFEISKFSKMVTCIQQNLPKNVPSEIMAKIVQCKSSGEVKSCFVLFSIEFFSQFLLCFLFFFVSRNAFKAAIQQSILWDYFSIVWKLISAQSEVSSWDCQWENASKYNDYKLSKIKLVLFECSLLDGALLCLFWPEFTIKKEYIKKIKL